MSHFHYPMVQVHWPFTDKNTKELEPPYKETWQAMETLVDEVCASAFLHQTPMMLADNGILRYMAGWLFWLCVACTSTTNAGAAQSLH